MIRSNLASQDFHTLRRQCHSNNKLFTDPHFPPENESLFYRQKSPVKIVWRRPPDFTSDPKLMVDGASRFDVTQGMLGDCWLLSAMASLAQKKSLLRVVNTYVICLTSVLYYLSKLAVVSNSKFC